MENVFKDPALAVSYEDRKKMIGARKRKLENILREFTLVGFLTMIFFSFSYAQVEKGDITKKLRMDARNSMNEESKIPVGTRNQFAEDFSNVQNVIWKVEPGYSEAEFTMNNKDMMAFYNYDDELIGQGRYVDYADLPAKGQERIAKDYPDYMPQKAMFYEDDLDDDNDFLNFFGNFLQHDAYFVLLQKDTKEVVVQVTEDGEVSYFSNVRTK